MIYIKLLKHCRLQNINENKFHRYRQTHFLKRKHLNIIPCAKENGQCKWTVFSWFFVYDGNSYYEKLKQHFIPVEVKLH